MNLETFLKEGGFPFEKHTHVKTYTSQELAHEEHVSGYQVAKPVIVKGATEYTMCVLPAPKHLDLKRVGDLLHDRQIRLATESEMAELFPGCELGAEPPVGSLFGMRTVMDAGLESDEYLVMQAGTHTHAIRMRREDWVRCCDPTVASIASA